MDFVKVKGKEFYYKGEPILFSGLGVGSWLNMEHFMLGLPGTDAQIRKTFEEVLGKEDGEKFFESFILNFLTDEDFRFLKETGVNLLRVPFSYRLFIDDLNPHTYKEEGFRYMTGCWHCVRNMRFSSCLICIQRPAGRTRTGIPTI